MGAQLYMCMHARPLPALESGCHPSLGTNMPDGVTTVRTSFKKKQHNLGGFLTLVQDCWPEAILKQSRAARLS